MLQDVDPELLHSSFPIKAGKPLDGAAATLASKQVLKNAYDTQLIGGTSEVCPAFHATPSLADAATRRA